MCVHICVIPRFGMQGGDSTKEENRGEVWGHASFWDEGRRQYMSLRERSAGSIGTAQTVRFIVLLCIYCIIMQHIMSFIMDYIMYCINRSCIVLYLTGTLCLLSFHYVFSYYVFYYVLYHYIMFCVVLDQHRIFNFTRYYLVPCI